MAVLNVHCVAWVTIGRWVKDVHGDACDDGCVGGLLLNDLYWLWRMFVIRMYGANWYVQFSD